MLIVVRYFYLIFLIIPGLFRCYNVLRIYLRIFFVSKLILSNYNKFRKGFWSIEYLTGFDFYLFLFLFDYCVN